MISSLLAVSTALVFAVSTASAHPGHHHVARRLAPSPTSSADASWYHTEDTKYHKLFRRGPATDGVQYAEVGSPEWHAAFPSSTPTSNPQEWTDALNAAVASGKIPDVPQTTIVNGSPSYPEGVDANSPEVCSSYVKCRLPGDSTIWDAPDGTVGISFDDGPIPGSSDVLYDFLAANNIPTTHFFIGVNILAAPQEFLRAFEMGGDIAVHTWTHPQMTLLSNEQVVQQLGWTMEIIHNSTGGRLPRFWRPPTGDADARVIAIAREVFGLTTVIWNQDTEDWSMATTNLTLATVESNLKGWYSGPKSPGLIILEHELTNDTVSGFIDTYPVAVQNGWKIVSVAQINGTSAYQNADGQTGAVAPVDDVLAVDVSTSSAPSSTPSSSTASAAKSAPATSQTATTSQAAANTTSNSKTNTSGNSQTNTSGALSALPPVFAALVAAVAAAIAL